MYIVFDLIEPEYAFVHTEKQAKDKADEFLNLYRDEAESDGWPEDIEKSIGYAKVVAQSKVTKTETKDDYGDEPWPYLHDEIWYIDIVKVDEE